jgi:hypothetical protein
MPRVEKMISILAPEYAPITFSIGFLEAPLDAVSDEYIAWQKEISAKGYPPITTKVVTGVFPTILQHLEPLGAPAFKTLFVPTHSARWKTAYFDGFRRGGDPFGPISMLSMRLRCHGAMVRHAPNTKDCYGVTGITLFGPDQTDFLNQLWVVEALNDGGPWRWNRNGPVLPFEEQDMYTKSRAKDRFTAEMLLRYCTALDIPLAEDQFGPGGMLVLPRQMKVKSIYQSLAQARAEYGL